jgi:VanZ family protein
MSSASRLASIRAVAPIALMALIFWGSAQSGGGGFPEWAHVIAHFSEYAALAALWAWALSPGLGRRAIALAGAISFLYAVSDEVHQSYVPGRFSDPWDVVVDSLGIVFALLAIRRVYGSGGDRPGSPKSPKG